jgi:hypothetical protein
VVNIPTKQLYQQIYVCVRSCRTSVAPGVLTVLPLPCCPASLYCPVPARPGIDTACQPKHYREDLVGQALVKLQQVGPFVCKAAGGPAASQVGEAAGDWISGAGTQRTAAAGPAEF